MIHQIPEIDIVHDEQRQFDSIFKDAFNSLKKIDSDSFIKNVGARGTSSLNIDDSTTLKFENSKSQIGIQVADIIAGFAMRFWQDFVNEVDSKVDIYFPSFLKLAFYDLPPSGGINFFVSDDEYEKLKFCASFNDHLNSK